MFLNLILNSSFYQSYLKPNLLAPRPWALRLDPRFVQAFASGTTATYPNKNRDFYYSPGIYSSFKTQKLLERAPSQQGPEKKACFSLTSAMSVIRGALFSPMPGLSRKSLNDRADLKFRKISTFSFI